MLKIIRYKTCCQFIASLQDEVSVSLKDVLCNVDLRDAFNVDKKTEVCISNKKSIL